MNHRRVRKGLSQPGQRYLGYVLDTIPILALDDIEFYMRDKNDYLLNLINN